MKYPGGVIYDRLKIISLEVSFHERVTKIKFTGLFKFFFTQLS